MTILAQTVRMVPLSVSKRTAGLIRDGQKEAAKVYMACRDAWNTEKTKTIWLIRAVKLVLRASMDRSGERAPIVRNAAITTNRRAVSGSVLFVGFQVIETW